MLLSYSTSTLVMPPFLRPLRDLFNHGQSSFAGFYVALSDQPRGTLAANCDFEAAGYASSKGLLAVVRKAQKHKAWPFLQSSPSLPLSLTSEAVQMPRLSVIHGYENAIGIGRSSKQEQQEGYSFGGTTKSQLRSYTSRLSSLRPED